MQTFKLVLPEHLNHAGFLFGGNLLEMGQFFYRNDGFLMLLAEDPDRDRRARRDRAVARRSPPPA